MSVHRLRNFVGALVLGAALVAVAGCGDSESGGSAAQGGGPGVAEAQTIAEKVTTRPTTLGFMKAIGKDVPTGKKVAFISCGVEACEIQGDIIKQGAADLGWTPRRSAPTVLPSSSRTRSRRRSARAPTR